MSSEVHIANRALQRVGESRIISALDEQTPQAEQCVLCLDDMRRAELQAHPWKFATKTVDLAEVEGRNEFGGRNVFRLPIDYLRMWRPQSGSGFVDREFSFTFK